jgi:hypothetical protein
MLVGVIHLLGDQMQFGLYLDQPLADKILLDMAQGNQPIDGIELAEHLIKASVHLQQSRQE